MTADQFTGWLASMREAGLARSDAAAGRLLGITADTIVKYKREGTDLRTALACRALYMGLAPWGA